jgi:hypothetical protein
VRLSNKVAVCVSLSIFMLFETKDLLTYNEMEYSLMYSLTINSQSIWPCCLRMTSPWDMHDSGWAGVHTGTAVGSYTSEPSHLRKPGRACCLCQKGSHSLPFTPSFCLGYTHVSSDQDFYLVPWAASEPFLSGIKI